MTRMLRRGLPLLILAVPALAQAAPRTESWFLLLFQGKLWLYLVVAAIAGYLFSIVFTMAFSRLGYPPNMARLGCWLGSVAWLIAGACGILPAFGVHLPSILLACLFLLVLFFGIVLMITRRQPNP